MWPRSNWPGSGAPGSGQVIVWTFIIGMIRSYSFNSTVRLALWAIVVLGVLLRLYRITANEFLFYDEGMYLGYNRSFLNLVAANPPRNIHELCIILGLMVKMA